MGIQNPVDLLLAISYAPGSTGNEGEPIKGFTRLQKLIFLLWKEAKFDEFVPELREFEAYNYGPFSSGLYDDIEFAESIDLLDVQKSKPELQLENIEEVEAYEDTIDLADIDPSASRTREDFVLNEKGLEVAKEIWSELGDEERRKLIQIKSVYNQMPFMQLIRYVYSKYPKYAKKSLLML